MSALIYCKYKESRLSLVADAYVTVRGTMTDKSYTFYRFRNKIIAPVSYCKVFLCILSAPCRWIHSLLYFANFVGFSLSIMTHKPHYEQTLSLFIDLLCVCRVFVFFLNSLSILRAIHLIINPFRQHKAISHLPKHNAAANWAKL